jgi:SAM-dependent methyltransferase
MDEESLKKFYELEYRKLYVGNPFPSEIFFQRQKNHGKEILNFIQAIDPDTPWNSSRKLVVEIGTGAGGILQAFKDAGHDVIGADLGSEYIDFGRNKGLDICVGTIDDILGMGRKADLVIYSHVLEHMRDPADELKKVRRLLAPKGLLYIEVPGVKSLTHAYRQDFLRSLQNAHLYYFSLQTLLNITARSGFSRVYADEEIRSIFQPGDTREAYTSDYEVVKKFLRKMEVLRLHPHNIHQLKGKVRDIALRFLRPLGMLGISRSLYYFMRHRKLTRRV